MLSHLRKFIQYWYLRYMLVTELYMVEPWERVVIHVLFGTIFFAMWYFNYSVLLRGISAFVGFTRIVDYVDVGVPSTT